MAQWLLALAVAGFTLQAVDNGALLSMLSLAHEYGKADPAKAELLEALSLAAGSARRWAHYSYLLVVGCWILLLYVLLYRFRLVPRALAAFGIAGSLLQISAVTLRALLGLAPLTVLAVPLAPAYVALAVWLIVKGFEEGRHVPPVEPPGAWRGEPPAVDRVRKASTAAASQTMRRAGAWATGVTSKEVPLTAAGASPIASGRRGE
jgi:hypothetical protein